MKKVAILISIVAILSVRAEEKTAVERVLKEGFNKQQTLLIKNALAMKITSRVEREGLADIAGKVIPWAIFEGLKPKQAAKIIIYMNKVVKAGVPFEDAEDLIPIVATTNISEKDFVLMALYKKETREGKVDQETSNAFLTNALAKKMDGYSILGGGRGLVLARSLGIDGQQAAKKLARALPRRGSRTGPKKIVKKIEKILKVKSKAKHRKLSKKMFSNYGEMHKSAKIKTRSIEKMQAIVKQSSKARNDLKKIVEAKLPGRKKFVFDKKGNLVPADEVKEVDDGSWKRILSKRPLNSVVKGWLGVRYKWGGLSKKGVDCSGFTIRALTDRRVGVPKKYLRRGVSQRKLGTAVDRSNINAGDLLFFSASPNKRKITHVALALGNNKFVHASTKGVKYNKLTQRYYKGRYIKARRIFKAVVE